MKGCLMVLLFVCITNPVWGQDTLHLKEVSVSVLPFQESYREATGGIFLLNTDRVEGEFVLTPTDLINLAPGAHMAEGTYSTTRLVIRGIGSRTPYGTNRIRAYLDDIPLTSGDGISTTEDLDPASIGLLEILKGPSSALYGSGLGGVVKLNSPYPEEDGFLIGLTGEYGSFGTCRMVAQGMVKSDRTAMSGGVSRSFSEGYRQNSTYSRNNLFLNARYFASHHTLTMTLSLVDLSAQIPSSLNRSDFENEPWKAAPNWLEVEGYEAYLKLLAGIGIESELGSHMKNHLVLFSSYSDPYESRPFNILDDRSVSSGFREYVELLFPRWKLRTGLEYFHEWYRWQIYETVQGEKGGLQSDHSEIRKYMNGFAMVQWRPAHRILIDGGLNLNLLQYGLETVFRADSADQSGSYRYDPVLSPRIGISVQHHGSHYFYAGAGHGFSPPSLEETLLPEGIINTDLKPETGWNIEAGNRGRVGSGRLEYDAAVYTIFLDNMLVTERISEDIFTGANAGKALNSGLEILVRYTLHPTPHPTKRNLSATIGYTFSHNRFTSFTDNGIDYAGNTLPGIPVQKLNTMFTGTVRELQLEVQYIYTGSQWMDDANENRYGGSHLIHLQGSWKLNFNAFPLTLEVRGGIRNILNTSYASMILVNAPSFGGNLPRYYYPGLPRQFHLGLRITISGKKRSI